MSDDGWGYEDALGGKPKGLFMNTFRTNVTIIDICTDEPEYKVETWAQPAQDNSSKDKRKIDTNKHGSAFEGMF